MNIEHRTVNIEHRNEESGDAFLPFDVQGSMFDVGCSPRPSTQAAAASLRPDRILLVHPLGYRSDAAANDVARLAGVSPPIGLAGLAAWLQREGIDASIVDAYAKPDALGRIRERLWTERPMFLGFSCTTSGFIDAAHLAAAAGKILPGIKTVIGGPHVSALKTKAFTGFPALDFGVAGEGERTLAELIRGGWEHPASVPGLIYRDAGGRPHFAGPRPDLIELDDLPFPAYEKLPGFPQAYRLPIFNYPRTPSTSCVSSRGCPYACSYCDRSVFGRSFRFNSAEYMLAMVRHLKQTFGIRHINYCDDQFTFHRERVMAFVRGLAGSDLNVSFNCAARAEHLDPELLRAMKAAGCWMISLGIETGDRELLARHRSHADPDRLRDCIVMIKRAGIRVKGLFMMGLPGETLQTIRNSMDYVQSLPLDDFSLTKFTPFPGSPLYAAIREHGTFDEDWQRMDCMNFQFIPKGLSRAELETMHQMFYRRHFLRPRTLWNYTSMIWKSPDSWRRFWMQAGTFFRFARKPKRLGAHE